MAKIYVISDIHCANENLSRFLAIAESDAEIIFCAGDLAGYGTELDDVIESLERAGVRSIQGNHDQYAIGSLEPQIQSRSLLRSVEMSRKTLSREAGHYLSGLPTAIDEIIDGVRVVINHGSLESAEDYLHGPERALDHVLSSGKTGYMPAECFFFGHTHHGYVHSRSRLVIANPGAISYPRGGTATSYISFDTANPAETLRLCDF